MKLKKKKEKKIMNEVLEKIQKIGIVPVVVLNDAKDAEPLAKALCNGGLPCAEVTFRTDAAEESIRIMSEKYPEMLIGAGTVLTTEQVDRAVAAGAKFIVSPGLNPKVVKYCVEKNIPITPGICTPSCKILPGRASRRTEDDQSYGSSIHRTEIHAYRWNQCDKCKRISCI